MTKTIAQGRVTYDFHRLMVAEGRSATLLKCSEFGQALIENM
jgi:isocitrate dehydrogenase